MFPPDIGSSRLDVNRGQNESPSTLIPSGLPIPFSSPNDQSRLDYFSAPVLPAGVWIEPEVERRADSTLQGSNMAHPQSFQSHPQSMHPIDQHAFPAYNHPSHLQTSYFDSFHMMPAQMQMQMQMDAQQQQQHNQQLQQAHAQAQAMQSMQQQQQQQQPSLSSFGHQQAGSSSLVQSFSQPMSRQDSAEDDEEYEEEEDNSEVMIPKDDIETRLKVAQEAQDAAASEGPNGVFGCPYCDKRYAGKHARSIWRRHLQDKHAIPLSQQPRRTRWDGDANRPKNAEERRQRMLESKRRWARKKRMSEKAGNKGTGEESPSDVSPTLSTFNEAQKQSTNQVNAGKKRQNKPKGPQQLKFHNITQGEMPTFVDFGSSNATSGNSGGGGMLWPTSTNGPFSGPGHGHNLATRARPALSHTLSSAHNFHAKEDMHVNNQQQTFAMMTSIASPRRVLAQIDTNPANGRRMMQQSKGATGEDGMMKNGQLSTVSPQFGTLDMGSKTTPLNRYSQLHPTPPSTGGAGKVRTVPTVESNGVPLLSPPSSHHTGESSPSYYGTNTLSMTAMAKRNSTASIFPPGGMSAASQRSPANNPFSLDRHKISPTTTGPQRALSDALLPPPSSNRLSSLMEDGDNKLSPIQNRTRSDAKAIASPLEKGRKLPPLVNTPLRPFKVEERATPSDSLGLLGGSVAGTASLRRGRTAGGHNNSASLFDTWKPMTTPTEEHADRMLGGTAGIGGFTPLNVKSAKYSSTRGTASITRPRRDLGGDQFSSPQHLNLTQSLGLAPHSTGKGAGFGGSVNATPFVNSFLASNSPWPESIMRPTFKTSATKRGREGGEESNEEGEEDDEDEEAGGEVFLHETPSRPAKHSKSTLLGSGSSVATAKGSNRLTLSASRDQYSMKPISFNLSSDREERAAKKPDSSLDSDLTAGKSSLLSTSPPQSDDGSSEATQSPTMSPRKRNGVAC